MILPNRVCLGLVESLLAGDASALSTLFAHYAHRVYNSALIIVRDHSDAEEIVNHTFAKAWHERDRFEPARGSFIVWLSVIARGRALDVLRARTRRALATSQYSMETFPTDGTNGCSAQAPLSAEQVVEHEELCEAMYVALAQLPRAQRTVIEMAYLGHYSHAEVAVQLGVPLGTVKTRARIALRHMRKSLVAANAA